MIIGFTGIELPQGKIKFHDQKLITLVNKDNPKKISPYFFEFVLDNFIKSFAIIVPKDKILVVEPRGVINTGDAGGELTITKDVWV